MSPRKDNKFKQALLACALCRTDDRGYFGAADVRGPFSKIVDKESGIQAFSQHLEAFLDSKRGPVLNRIGEKRSYKFRFTEPLLQPYVIMQGLATGLITRDGLSRIYG